MKAGARNQIEGTVLSVEKGDVMAKAKLSIPAESIMASVMTRESVEDLDLKEGDKVRILVKAINVLLVKE